MELKLDALFGAGMLLNLSNLRRLWPFIAFAAPGTLFRYCVCRLPTSLEMDLGSLW